MPSELLLITILCLFIVPAYFIFLIFFRDGVFFPEYLYYNKKAKQIEDSKISQQYKAFYNPYILSFLFLLVSFLIVFILLLIFYFIVNRDLALLPFKKGDLVVLLGLLISNMFLFFGVGVYVVSITVANLKSSIIKLKKAGVSTNRVLMYRGSISHVAMVLSMGLSFLLISFLENWNLFFTLTPTYFYLCILNGVVFGLIFSLSQIYSGTWKHQLPIIIFIYIVQSYLFFNVAPFIIYQPFTIFSFFSIMTILVVDLYLLFKHLNGKITYKYD